MSGIRRVEVRELGIENVPPPQRLNYFNRAARSLLPSSLPSRGEAAPLSVTFPRHGVNQRPG